MRRRLKEDDEKMTSTSESKDDLKPVSVVSGGVHFYPPSKTLWRIGGAFYDFTEFLNRHPGGAQVMLLARDRFEDATFVFEAHHHNYKKARAMIRKYKVEDGKMTNRRPRRDEKIEEEDVHFDDLLDKGKTPQLMDDDSFYSVLRLRVAKHLRDVGYPDGGPTYFCVFLFWFVFSAWFLSMYVTYTSGSYLAAMGTGIIGSWLGAFGHNWVHQAKPKQWGWAILSLDVIGFSSETWFRKHNLQHHMYTNTPWDNHYTGTDPFLVTDPTRQRGWWQKNVLPYCHPIVFFFGPYVNYVTHFISILKGHEDLSVGKIFLPVHILLWIHRFGFSHGFSLALTTHGIIGLYYFTLALVNHNAEHTLDVRSRNKALDWGEAQLHVSADWAVNSSFMWSIIYLWLNFHTVHHLFPRVDFSHHPAIQQILVKTCKDFNIKYKHGNLFTLWLEMVRNFGHPVSPFEMVYVYGGGL